MYIEGEENKEARKLTEAIKQSGKELEELLLKVKSGEISIEKAEEIIARNKQNIIKKDIKKDGKKKEKEDDYERD